MSTRPRSREGVGQLLGEERIALRLGVDERLDRVGNAQDPEPAGDEHRRVRVVELDEPEMLQHGHLAQEHDGGPVPARPGTHHRQRARNTPCHLLGQFPGRLVEPVAVVEDDHLGPSTRGPGHQPGDQLPGRLGPPLALEEAGGLALGETQGEDGVQERAQLLHLGTEEFGHPSPAATGVGQRREVDDAGHDLPPRVIGRATVDGARTPLEDPEPEFLGPVPGPGHQRGLADPRFPLDHHDTADPVRGEVVDQGAHALLFTHPSHQVGGTRRHGAVGQPEGHVDADRCIEALYRDLGESLEDDLIARGTHGCVVHVDTVPGDRHEPGGQVHGPADHRVVASTYRTDRSGEDPSGGDADARTVPEGRQSGADLQGDLHAARGIVLVGVRRGAEDRDDHVALVARAHVLEHGAVAGQHLLDGADQRVHRGQRLRGRLVEVREVHEHGRHQAQLTQPVAESRVRPGQYGLGHVGQEQLADVGGHLRRLGRHTIGRIRHLVQPDAATAARRSRGRPVDQGPGLPGEDHFARVRLGVRHRDLVDRLTGEYEMPPTLPAAHGRHHGTTRSHGDVHAEFDVLTGRIPVEFLLDDQAADGGPDGGVGHRQVGGGPEGEKGVAEELHRLPTVVPDDVHEAPVVAVEDGGEAFRPLGAVSAELRRQGGEPGDVGEQRRTHHRHGFRLREGARFGHEPSYHE